MAKNREYQNSKLYYIHGYQSNPDSTKGVLLQQQLNVKPIAYRDGKPENLIITDCLQRIAEVIKDDADIVLIGSSLGGYLAAATALDNTNVTKLILLNPAILPPGTNIKNHQGVPERILKDMVNPQLFEKKLDTDITLLVGTDDEVIPREWILEFAMAQEATIRFFHDDHRFSKNIQRLPTIIAQILGMKL